MKSSWRDAETGGGLESGCGKWRGIRGEGQVVENRK